MITYERRLDRIFEKWIKCTKKEKRAAISHNYKLEVTPGFSLGRWSQWSKKRSLSGGKFSVNFSYHFKWCFSSLTRKLISWWLHEFVRQVTCNNRRRIDLISKWKDPSEEAWGSRSDLGYSPGTHPAEPFAEAWGPGEGVVSTSHRPWHFMLPFPWVFYLIAYYYQTVFILTQSFCPTSGNIY